MKYMGNFSFYHPAPNAGNCKYMRGRASKQILNMKNHLNHKDVTVLLEFRWFLTDHTYEKASENLHGKMMEAAGCC